MISAALLTFVLLIIASLCANETSNGTVLIKNCQFFIDGSSESFIFLSCSTPTLKHQLSWKSCISSCCDDMDGADYAQPSEEALNLCQMRASVASDASEMRTVTLVSIGIGSSIIFASLMILICKVFSPCCTYKVASSFEQEDLGEEWLNQRKKISRALNKLVWVNEEGEAEAETEMGNVCSICLEDGCFSQLYCQHQYHASCIGAWLQRSNFCPLCHHINIKAIKQYCSCCRHCYVLLEKRVFVQSSSVLAQIKCSKCSEKNPKAEILALSSSNRGIQQKSRYDASSQNMELAN